MCTTSGMSRRNFLQLLPFVGVPGVLSGATSTACAPSASLATTPPRIDGSRRKIRGICFDLFTLFDPRSVQEVAKTVVGEGASELCEAWRVRQFEYCWLRLGAKQYADFRTVTDEALEFAARARGLTLSEAARHTLVDAYSHLSPWPDAKASLVAWKEAGLRLAPLANYSPTMLHDLIANAGFADFFATQISTDVAKTFKPDPVAYALGESRLGLAREEIAFAAFGGWDAAGAKWFGFPTFWVNRLGVAQEQLVAPDGTGPTLAELGDFVAKW
jgi:2-haloacid dehalogenase